MSCDKRIQCQIYTLLERQTPSLALRFKNGFKGRDDLNSISQYFIGVLQQMDLDNGTTNTFSMQIYLIDRANNEARWFHYFDQVVLPYLSNNG